MAETYDTGSSKPENQEFPAEALMTAPARYLVSVETVQPSPLEQARTDREVSG